MKMLKALFVMLLCTSMALPCCARAKTRVIAHRGYWKTEGSAQNSIRALELAHKIKVYGSEFDVHLTSDDVPVVFHDHRIGEREIQQTPYAELKEVRLANEETLPTLERFLTQAAALKGMRLICEVKSHATADRDREAARIVVEMVGAKGLSKRTEYIAFSLEAAKELHRLSPETPVYYLNGDLPPAEIAALGFAGMDYHYNVMREHPEWFAEAKKLGLKINVWTVDDMQTAREMIDGGADFITTDLPEQVQETIRDCRR